MRTLAESVEVLAVDASCDSDTLTVTLSDGRVVSAPLAWFPRLLEATPRQVLEFVLYGSEPRDMETRLWAATHEPEWRLPHFGKSILGEAVGWARPKEYPPRNNRTNKALRALGYDVKLFASE